MGQKQPEPITPNPSGRYRVNLGPVAYLELNIEAWLENSSLPDTAGRAVTDRLNETLPDRNQKLEAIGKRVNMSGEQLRNAILDGRITTDLQLISD